MSWAEAKLNTDTRTCTCHPDDVPPVPCPRKFALTECRVAELLAATEFLTQYDDDGTRPADNMTGTRLSFGELRRIVKARAALPHWR